MRRAVTLGPVAADPGEALTPAVPRSTAAAAPSAPDTSAPDTSSRPGTSSAPVTAAASEEPTLPGNGSAPAEEAPTTAPTTALATASALTTEADETPAEAPDAKATREFTRETGPGAALPAEEPPSGPSRKPLLAAVGLVGVVILAVPLVAWATSDSGHKNDHLATTASTAERITDPPATVPHIPLPQKSSASPAAKPTTKPKVRTKSVVPRPPAPPSPKARPTATPTKKAKTPYLGPGPQMPGDDRTASAAVLRLAAREPGRHICYRVYVATFGWQLAVCDGSVAGSEVDARSIKAIQIAVSGTKGTSANAYFQAKGWVNKSWVTVEDGADLTLGAAKQDAPNISGFGISVGRATGTVCQNTYSRGGPWGSMACDTPQTADNYIFGGTLDETRWLDAVRFTV
ncbi:hypothetical protein BGM09_22950 [Streptomyces sp. CBMA29]|nr:hypothetical protein [Streptomyces sp. CBMA29]